MAGGVMLVRLDIAARHALRLDRYSAPSHVVPMGNHDHQDQIQQYGHASGGKGQDDLRNAHQHGINIKVVGQPGTDACNLAGVLRAIEPFPGLG
jgi:hypothetical protein